jgi:hypothetical protein
VREVLYRDYKTSKINQSLKATASIHPATWKLPRFPGFQKAIFHC